MVVPPTPKTEAELRSAVGKFFEDLHRSAAPVCPVCDGVVTPDRVRKIIAARMERRASSSAPSMPRSELR
jgi:hypothetical protein